MYRLLKSYIVLVLFVLILIFPVNVLAAPGSQDPPGSPITFIEIIPVDITFVISASDGSCPFDVTTKASGWMQFHVRFDQAGNFVAGIETRHIVYSFSANGKSVSDLMTLSQKVDDYVENSDGTVTATYTFAGHASLIPSVGADIGRITFAVTFDPNTGQEFDLRVLEHSGQLSGLYISGDSQAQASFCALLAP